MLLVFGMAVTAGATPYTWTDKLDFNPEYMIGWKGPYTYIHDITDDGPVPFVVGEDLVYNYSLSVSLEDDGLDFTILEIETAFIDQPGTSADAYYDFTYTDNTYGCSIAGVLSLGLLGKLWLTVDPTWGDFFLVSSTLTAYGENNTPIPEPATMLLLGSGLVGFAGFRRKFKK